MTVVLVAVLALAACGGDNGDPEAAPPTGGTSPPATGVPAPPPSLPPTPVVPPAPSPPASPPPPGTGEITLTGQVYAGVEAGCWLLATAQGDYLLLGDAVADLRSAGQTVRVRGEVRNDVATTCQQGTPFFVSEVLD